MLSPGSGNAGSHGRRHRLKYFLLAAGAVLGLQILCLDLRITSVSPELYAENAVDLKITRKWRYGFMQLWHGAVFVKARNTDHTANDIWEPQTSAMDGQIYGIMQQELKAMPRKAALEAALYLGILAYVFFGWEGLEGFLLAKLRSRVRLLLAMVLSRTLFWVIAGWPLFWGYGTPLFTNCLGPGALSSSGLFLGAAPAYSITVTYHVLIAGISPFFLILAHPIFWIAGHIPGISEGLVVWLAGLQFCVAWGLLQGLCRCFF